jgi:hypothetical protein
MPREIKGRKMPDLFDVIELAMDIPERGLRAGMQGIIVERHPGDAYEVEFTNEVEGNSIVATTPIGAIE